MSSLNTLDTLGPLLSHHVTAISRRFRFITSFLSLGTLFIAIWHSLPHNKNTFILIYPFGPTSIAFLIFHLLAAKPRSTKLSLRFLSHFALATWIPAAIMIATTHAYPSIYADQPRVRIGLITFFYLLIPAATIMLLLYLKLRTHVSTLRHDVLSDFLTDVVMFKGISYVATIVWLGGESMKVSKPSP